MLVVIPVQRRNGAVGAATGCRLLDVHPDQLAALARRRDLPLLLDATSPSARTRPRSA
ncbi:hypothetical protein [Streptomyces toxytricini]|uniref:hypothetical protein n=1 Tax=Streptomyces toxytricini TaxID=67369 RepID=UPI003425BF23